MNTPPPYSIGYVTSADGTTIGYRKIGSGPGVLIVHGGVQASQHYIRLGTALANTFTVYIHDRRGRGLSGPHGEDYSISKECQDIDALLTRTDTHFVFGHSSGALIALQAALTLPSVRKVAVYEPPLSLNGSVPISWLPRYEREVAQGKFTQALITMIKGLKLSQATRFLPRWLLVTLMEQFLQREKRGLKPGDIPIETLIPTQRFDMQLVKEMNGRLESFSNMQAEVLLIGGDKSPVFLCQVLDALYKVLPHVRRTEYMGMGHEGPSESAVGRTAWDLETFFTSNE